MKNVTVTRFQLHPRVASLFEFSATRAIRGAADNEENCKLRRAATLLEL